MAPRGGLAASHVLKATLDFVKPPVWRRIQVPISASLDDLHVVLQIAMGWEDAHLYGFNAGKQSFSPARESEDMFPMLEEPGTAADEETMRSEVVEGLKQLVEMIEHPEEQPEKQPALSTLVAGMGASESLFGQMDEDTSMVEVGEVLKRARSKMKYTYDFGDGWDHTIVVERANVPTNPDQPAICLDGAGACPPEDCGGPWGYQRILEAIKNPDDPEYEDEREWLEDWIEGFDPGRFDREAVNKSLSGLVWSVSLT